MPLSRDSYVGAHVDRKSRNKAAARQSYPESAVDYRKDYKNVKITDTSGGSKEMVGRMGVAEAQRETSARSSNPSAPPRSDDWWAGKVTAGKQWYEGLK
jgi:hypothetical protein